MSLLLTLECKQKIIFFKCISNSHCFISSLLIWNWTDKYKYVHTHPWFPWKPYPVPDQNGQSLYPLSDQQGPKTIPFGSAHTYMAYIRESAPPPWDSTKLESWAVHTFLKNLTKYYMLSNSLHNTCCTFPLPNFSTASHQAEAAPGTVTVCAELYGRWTSPSFTMPVVFNRSSDSLDAALPLNWKTTNMIKILILVIPLIKLQIAACKKIHKGLNYTSK